jgi:hypothetical protein
LAGPPGGRRATPHGRQISAAHALRRPVRGQPCLAAHCPARGPGPRLVRAARLSPWRRPGDPLMLVKRSQGRLKPVRPAKPPKPRRDLPVIPFPMIAAGGAYQLIHGGVAALDAAVHDADRLAPQERLTAVTGMTGGRGCHGPLGRDNHRSVRGAGSAHLTHLPGAGSRSCHYQGLEQRRCYPHTVTRRSAKHVSSRGQRVAMSSNLRALSQGGL